MASEIDIYFLEPCVLVAKDAFQIEELRNVDRKELLQFYFSVASQCEISGDYLENTSRQAYKILMKDVLSYRKAVNRDEFFIRCADEYGYSFATAKLLPDDHALNIANVGVFCSDNPKDLKFALKTARQFLKYLMKSRNSSKKFMDNIFSAPADIVAEMRTFNSAYFQIALALLQRRSHEQLESVLADSPAISFPAELITSNTKRMNYDELLSFSRAQARKAKEFNYATLIVLLGEEVGKWIATLFDMEELSQTDVVHCIQSILPDPVNIPFFKAHRITLCQNVESFFLETYEDPEDMLRAFAKTMVYPMVDIIADLKELSGNAYLDKIEAERRARTAEQALKKADFSAQTTEVIENLQTQIDQQIDTIKDLQEQLAQLEKDLCKANNQVDDLTEKLAVSQLANQRLNALLIDSMNDEETEDDSEDESSTTGLKDRLGEDVCDLLAQRKVYIIGGHASAHTRITELFSHWKIARVDESPAFAKGGTSYDLILIVSSHCAHKQQYAAKKLAKSTGTPLAMCHKNSAFGICMGAYESLAIG